MTAIAQKAQARLLRRRRQLTHLRQENESDEQQALQMRPADWPDLASEQEAAQVAGRLSEHERAELVEIDDALKRVEAGTFGRCERCAAAIGGQRLTAIPQTRYCVRCEALVERGE